MRDQLPGKKVFLPVQITLLIALLLTVCSCGDDDSPRSLVTTINPGNSLTDRVVINGFRSYSAEVLPGSLYKISMTGPSDDADLLFFGTDGSFTNLNLCGVDNTEIEGTVAEDCIVAAGGSTLYFGIDGTFLSTSEAVFTVSVERLEITNLNLAIPIQDDTSGRRSVRVYALPVSQGNAYTAAITGLTDDAELYLLNDGNLTERSGCTYDNTQFTGSTPEDCTFTAADSTVYLVVDGIFGSAPSILFTVLAAPAPSPSNPVNQGSVGAPAVLLSGTATTGSAVGTSYYTVAGLTAGSRYTISISGLTSDADLAVYGIDNSFTAAAACSVDNTFFTGRTPESCTLTVSGTALYFKVTSAAGAAYIMLMEPGP